MNLLRLTQINLRLSGYVYLFGQFNFNKTPLVPPGIKILVHDKLDNRPSWAPDRNTCYVVAPTMENYECLKEYLLKKKTERPVDIVTFFPTDIPIPK